MKNHATLSTLETPCLLIDEAKMMKNIHHLRTRSKELGVSLRPHLKTSKSIEIANLLMEDKNAPVTVSTLREAEFFADKGLTNILYAVGIAPDKLDRVVEIRNKGCDLSILLDSVEQAKAIAKAAKRLGAMIPALIEIDCDGHRGGLKPQDDLLIEIAEILQASPAELRGVLTHAGDSYNTSGKTAHAACAAQERNAVVQAADKLKQAGFKCPIISVGSTPTAHAVQDLTGVTELRAGVYTFFDLVMAGIKVCQIEDIALSVLTTVIGHQNEKGWLMVDAGWMAMSRDRGTARQKIDQGYGLVCSEQGTLIPDLVLSDANQEHGIITVRSGDPSQLPDLPIGTKLRILPNHACATSAQHSGYHVIAAEKDQPIKYWPRISGW